MPYRKRAPAKRRPAYRRKPAPRRRRAPASGGFTLRRRVPLIGIRASTAAVGTVDTTNSQVVKLGAVVASATGLANTYDVPFACELHLSDLDSVSDITNICDKYRIAGAAFKFISNPTSYFSGAAQPFIQFVHDYDDSLAPTASVLNQKMGLTTRTFNAIGMTSMRFRPKPATQLYNSAISTAYAVPARAPFINTANPDVPHYCVKGIFRNMYLPGVSTAAMTLQLDIALTIVARDIQ